MPLLWLSLAFLAGIALAGSGLANTQMESLLAWLLLVGLSLALLILRHFTRPHLSRFSIPWRHLPLPLSALLLAFALGGVRYIASLPDLQDKAYVAYYNHPERVYRMTGVLRSPPEVSDRSIRMRLSTESLLEEGQQVEQPVEGTLLVTDWDMGDWSYGDRLQVTGTLEIPPEGEGFSYREYLERQGIYSAMQPDQIKHLGSGYGNRLLAALYSLRDRLLALTYRLYPDPEASLLAGILLGVESGIPADVKNAFQDSGTAHIIAISG